MLHRVAISVFLVASVIGCKKGEKTEKVPGEVATAAGSGATPTAPQPDKAASTDSSDTKYSKPALTEDKIQRYIKAVSTGKGPFAVVGAMMGKGSLADMQAAVTEQETFAKQQGFASAADYMDTAGRIMLGEVMLMAAEGNATMRASVAKTIADNEAQLADPKLPAETRTALTGMVDEYKKQLAEMDTQAKASGDLNPADLALVKKFKTELDAAEKASAEAMKAKK